MARGIPSDPALAEARRQKISAGMKRVWQDPEQRAHRIEKTKQAHADGRMGDYSWFKGLQGEQTTQWVGDEVSYRAAHARISSWLGPANQHACVDCGQQAQDWTLRHDTPEERIKRGRIKKTGPLLAYAPYPEHYDPRCRSCHIRYDKKDS